MYIKSVVLTVLFISIFNSIFVFGQYKNELSIGVLSKSYFFQSYNKHDWQDKPYMIIDNPRSPNGYSFGLAFEFNLTDDWGIISNITYSKQNQKYLWSHAGAHSGGVDIYIHNVSIKRDLNYINIPFQYYYYKELGYESHYFVKISLGVNISYLSKYVLTSKEYFIEGLDKIRKDSIRHFIEIDNDKYQRESIDSYDGSLTIYNGEVSNPFHRFTLGVIGGASIERYFLNKVKIGLGFDIYHAFTNIEVIKEGEYWHGFNGYGHSKGSKGPTLNRYVGLSFSVKYILNPQSYY